MKQPNLRVSTNSSLASSLPPDGVRTQIVIALGNDQETSSVIKRKRESRCAAALRMKRRGGGGEHLEAINTIRHSLPLKETERQRR